MIDEKRCSTGKDFIVMFLENNKVWKPFKYRTKEDMALSVWNDLLKKEEKFYNKYGYIDVVYDSKTNEYYRKKTRGRPQAIKTKDNRVTVRLNTEQLSALDNYCQTNNIEDKSEVIRKAIMNYVTSTDNRKDNGDSF